MATTPTTPTPKTSPPSSKTNIGKLFENWASGRSGFSRSQLIDLFINTYSLSPAHITDLQDYEKEILAKSTLLTPSKTTPSTTDKKPAIKPGLVIPRTPYPKWWKELRTAPINILGPATQIIVAGKPNFRVYIATIVLTVSDKTDISFSFGAMGISGSMNFGGTNEPKGIVIAMGDSPAPCGAGGFSIYSSGVGVSVGGFATFYQEKEEVSKTTSP